MLEGFERAVLAGGMNGAEMPSSLTSDSFVSPIHRTIFEAIVSQPVPKRNLLAVQEVLRASGELERVGGAAGLTSIHCETITPPILEYSIACVLDASRQRRAATIGQALHKGDITLLEALEQLSQLSDPQLDLPSIEDAVELIAREIVLPCDVIEGLLHRGAKMVLGGGSKSNKTWLLINAAVSVASGMVWLARATKRGRVLYLNFEIQPAFFAKRIATICAHRRIEIEPGYLSVWNLRGHAADLSQLLSRLLQRIRRDDYDLIVIDPVYKLLGARDENKAGDIASLLNEIEVLAVRTGAAVAFGAHYSKGNQAGKESIDRIGGSGVFARDPDTILSFTKHEQKDCFTVDATLRNHPPIQPFVVRWQFPVLQIENELDPERLKKPAGRKQKYATDDVLELLDAPMSVTDWQKRAEGKLGLSESTFYRRLVDIKKQGVTTQRADEKWERK
jgi:hypothetical protein